MPNTRILLGYRTEHRNSESVVLAKAARDDTLRAAVDAAPAEFVRFELGVFHFQRKARRGKPAPEQAATPESVDILDALNQATQRINELVVANGNLAQCGEQLLTENIALRTQLQTLPATPARETVVAEGASSAAASGPASPAADVVGPAVAAADDAASGGEDDDETPLIPGQSGGKKRR